MLLADVLRRPTFPAEHVERVRNQKLVRIQEREQDTQEVAGLRFYEAIYAGHPYADPEPRLCRQHRRYSLARSSSTFIATSYTPDGCVIVVTGDVQTDRVIDLIREQLCRLARAGVGPERARRRCTYWRRRRLFYPMSDKVQSDIVIGATPCLAIIPISTPSASPIRSWVASA